MNPLRENCTDPSRGTRLSLYSCYSACNLKMYICLVESWTPNPSRGVSDAFLSEDIKGVVVLCHSQRIIYLPFALPTPCLPTDEHHQQLPGGCPPTPSLVSSGRQDRSKSQSTNSPSANSTINTTPTPESLPHRESAGERHPLLSNATSIYPDN